MFLTLILPKSDSRKPNFPWRTLAEQALAAGSAAAAVVAASGGSLSEQSGAQRVLKFGSIEPRGLV